MIHYIDTEFIEAPCMIDLISLALVSEDGRELYMISSEFDESKASDWVKENVIAKLGDQHRHTIAEIKEAVLKFVGEKTPDFWGDYCAYDWVVFCWLFGTMMDLPSGWPMYCNDIRPWYDMIHQDHAELALKDFKDSVEAIGDFGNHNALYDAHEVKKLYEYLIATSETFAHAQALVKRKRDRANAVLEEAKKLKDMVAPQADVINNPEATNGSDDKRPG